MNIEQQFARAAEWMNSVRAPLLISHEKPDGDALGSLSALSSMLTGLGKSPTALLFDELPGRYELFRGHQKWKMLPPGQRREPLASFDSIIIMDTSTYSQLTPIAEWLKASSLPKLVIDHHQTRDPIGDFELADTSTAATCLILHELAQHANWEVNATAAAALFVGIATDTGWFRHSNTDSRALCAASQLAAAGVRPHELFQSLYQRDPAARLRLLGMALQSLCLQADNRLAFATVDQKAFADSGATPADTEDIVNEPLRIESVVVSILFVEQSDGVIRVNFRSKPPLSGQISAAPDIDVAALAAHFGGGGHTRAAGARISGTLAEVQGQVQRKVMEALVKPVATK